MDGKQFFGLYAKRIADRCIVTVEGSRITLHALWTGNVAAYQSKSTAEYVAIITDLAKAGAVIKARVKA